MALEPQIALGVQVPTPQNPVDTYAKIENVKTLAEQRQALADQRQQKAQKFIQDARDKATMNAAVQAAQGNPVEASKQLRAQGFANVADALDGITSKNQQAAETAIETHLKNQGTANDHAMSMLQTATPENWWVVRGGVLGLAGAVDPDAAQQLVKVLPKEFDKQAVAGVLNGALTHKDYVDKNLAALKELQSGNVQQGIALALSQAPDQTQGQTLGKADVLKSIAGIYHVPAESLLPWQQMIAQGAQGQQFLDATLTQEQRNQAADRKATADREAAKATTKSVLLDGKPAEVRVNPQGQFIDDGGAVIESSRVKPIQPASASAGVGATPNDPKDIAAAIIRGEQPPVFTGMYRDTAPIKAELARQGYPLAKATEDWTATQKYLATLNGQQQTRLRQAIDFTGSSLDLVEDLSKQWDAGGFPILNSAQLSLAKNGAMGPKAQQIATKLSAQISDLTSELGTVYKGGNSSTDESLKLAAKNLSENWSKDTLLANVDQIRKNLAIRQNSMTLAGGAAGVNKGNPYTPPASPLDVTDPAGKTHHFDTPAQAQAFP